MSRPIIPMLLILLAALAIPVLNAGRGAVQQEPTLAERVAKLENEIKVLNASVAELSVANELSAQRLQTTEAWMATFVNSMITFHKGLDLTVEQGFTYAGANLHARETLITSLRQFAKALVPASASDKK